MTDSPYAVIPRVPNQAQFSESLMLDSTTGSTRLVHAETITVIVDPVTLDQTTTSRKVLLWSVSGQPIAPGAPTFPCRHCHREPFSESEVLACRCGRKVCRDRCTRPTSKGDQCPRCAWRTRLKEFLTWLFHL